MLQVVMGMTKARAFWFVTIKNYDYIRVVSAWVRVAY